jgi:hypothetical protein
MYDLVTVFSLARRNTRSHVIWVMSVVSLDSVKTELTELI